MYFSSQSVADFTFLHGDFSFLHCDFIFLHCNFRKIAQFLTNEIVGFITACNYGQNIPADRRDANASLDTQL